MIFADGKYHYLFSFLNNWTLSFLCIFVQIFMSLNKELALNDNVQWKSDGPQAMWYHEDDDATVASKWRKTWNLNNVPIIRIQKWTSKCVQEDLMSFSGIFKSIYNRCDQWTGNKERWMWLEGHRHGATPQCSHKHRGTNTGSVTLCSLIFISVTKYLTKQVRRKIYFRSLQSFQPTVAWPHAAE